MWFDGVRQPDTLYVASVSRGKDSTAMLRAIQLMGWPLDMITAVDIWATDDIPAELPPMVAFKDEWDEKCLERFGLPVTRLCARRKVDERERERERRSSDDSTPRASTETQELHTRNETGYTDSPSEQGLGATQSSKSPRYEKMTYEKGFYHVPKRRPKPARERERERERASQRDSLRSRGTGVAHSRQEISVGYIKGFPNTPQCKWCPSLKKCTDRQILELAGMGNAALPLVQLNAQKQSSRPAFSEQPRNEGRKINIVHYIGIAADEPLRIERHMKNPKKILPLVQIGWDEALCGLEAQYMDMLSPTYETGERDGCWFCHNQGVGQLRLLRKNYPDLWTLLMKWDLDSPVSFHADGHTVHDFDRRFQLEDEGFISPDGKGFKWSMLDEELNYRWF